jgi:hypothetical protein
MRYFSYNEYDPDHPDGGYVVTVSEEDISRDYYEFWYGKMCEKFGKEHVDANYSSDDCIEDWVIIHWAWEVKQDESFL